MNNVPRLTSAIRHLFITHNRNSENS